MPIGIYARKTHKLICKKCANSFVGKTLTTQFCSIGCYRKYRYLEIHDRERLRCNKWRYKNRERLNGQARLLYHMNDDKKKWSRKYEKTYFGYLMRKYRNMESRIMGIQKKKFHLYKGLKLLPRKDFYEWAKNSNEYKNLFEKYVASKYNRKLAPSVNRIDPKCGYILNNMEWITHSENSRLGSINRNNKLKI